MTNLALDQNKVCSHYCTNYYFKGSTTQTRDAMVQKRCLRSKSLFILVKSTQHIRKHIAKGQLRINELFGNHIKLSECVKDHFFRNWNF